jgi:hypothetical protein
MIEATRKTLFSSQNLTWRTPNETLRELHKEFNFDFDPCPPNPTTDGLTIEWGKSNFVNPPYGREVGRWVKKGYNESLKGKIVVFLLASRTGTSWFQDYCLPFASEIRFIRGRLKFGDSKNSAPFDSVIVIFNSEIKK